MPLRALNTDSNTGFRLATPAFDPTRDQDVVSIGLYFKVNRNPSQANHVIAHAVDQLRIFIVPISTTQFDLNFFGGWDTVLFRWRMSIGQRLDYGVPYYAVAVYNHTGNVQGIYVNKAYTFINSSNGTLTDPSPRVLQMPSLQNQDFTNGGQGPDLFVRELWIARKTTTQSEVDQLFTGTLTPAAHGATNHWNFDGTPGVTLAGGQTALNDRIGTAHFGVSVNAANVQYVDAAEVSFAGVARLNSPRVLWSGKTLELPAALIATSAFTRIRSVATHPTIKVNGGAPIQLTADRLYIDDFGPGVGNPPVYQPIMPGVYYNLHGLATVNAGDTVTLSAPLSWAAAAQGDLRAETDLAVTNSTGANAFPLQAAQTTTKIGWNVANCNYGLTSHTPYANQLAVIEGWGWTGSHNANGIPIGLNGSGQTITVAKPGAALSYNWGLHGGANIPINLDILVKVTTTDPASDVRLFTSGQWNIDPDPIPPYDNPVSQGVATLMETTIKPYGYVRRYRVAYVNNPVWSSINLNIQMFAGGADNIELFYDTDPANPINPDSPPKWDPGWLRKARTGRLLRTLGFFKSLGGMPAHTPSSWGPIYPGRMGMNRSIVLPIANIGPYNDAAPGWVNYFGFSATGGVTDDDGVVEITTSSPHGIDLTHGHGIVLGWGGTGANGSPNGTLLLDNGLMVDNTGWISGDAYICLPTATNRIAAAFLARSSHFARFNGSTDYFSAANHASLRPTQSGTITIAARARMTNKSTSRVIFWLGGHLGLHYNQATDSWRVRASNTGGTGFATVSTTGVNVATNTWYNVIAEINGATGQMRLWIDNALDGDITHAGLANALNPTWTNEATVGCVTGDYSSKFQGDLRDVVVWHRALTALERTWLHNSGSFRRWEETGVGGTDGANLRASCRAWWGLREMSMPRFTGNGAVNRSDSSGNGCTLSEPPPSGTPPTFFPVRSGQMARPVNQSAPAGFWMANTNSVLPPPSDLGELAAQIAGGDLWVCVPDLFTDAGVIELIDGILSTLPVGRKLYVEYSNEHWNTGINFPISWRCQALARVQGKGATRIYVERAKQIHDIAVTRATAVGRAADLRRVMATQWANSGVTGQITTACTAIGATFDVLAVAPYIDHPAPFGSKVRHEHILDMIGIQMSGGPHAQFDARTIEAVLTEHRTGLDSAGFTGVKLSCYEFSYQRPIYGGDQMTAVYRYALHHPLARNLYQAMLKKFEAAGLEAACKYKLEDQANYLSNGVETSWGTYRAAQARPGVGDGSDGLYDNRTYFQYSSDTATIPFGDTYKLVNPQALAFADWNDWLDGSLEPGPGLVSSGARTWDRRRQALMLARLMRRRSF